MARSEDLSLIPVDQWPKVNGTVYRVPEGGGVLEPVEGPREVAPAVTTAEVTDNTGVVYTETMLAYLDGLRIYRRTKIAHEAGPWAVAAVAEAPLPVAAD